LIRVRFSLLADAQLRARRLWWRENRDKAPDLFDRELGEAVDRLARNAAMLPIFARRSGHVIRRYLMPRTRCHPYLEVTENPPEVIVLAAGGGQRKRSPRFRLQDAA
jgi:hypothetical protein